MALWRPGHRAPGWVITDLLWPHMLMFRSLVCRDSSCSVFCFFNLFYWSRVDLRCCVNVYCTVKWSRFICMCAKPLIHVWLFATLWAAARQTLLSMGFYRQEYYSGLLCPPLGDLLNPGTEPASCVSCIAGGFFTAEPPGNMKYIFFISFSIMVYHRIFTIVPCAIQ